MEREFQFVIDPTVAQAFLTDLGAWLVEDIFDAARPVAYTRTTYLDTPTLAHFHASQPTRVRRLRIREYAGAETVDAPPLLSGLCALEFKETRGTTREKVRFVAPPRAIAKAVATGICPVDCPPLLTARLISETLVPVLTTFYRRQSFRSVDGRVRVTLDDELVFCHPVRPGEAGEGARPTNEVARFASRILEVKCLDTPPAWLREPLGGLEATCGFSKFRAGMTAVHGAAKGDEGGCASETT